MNGEICLIVVLVSLHDIPIVQHIFILMIRIVFLFDKGVAFLTVFNVINVYLEFLILSSYDPPLSLH